MKFICFAFKAPKGSVGGPTFSFAADLIFVLFCANKRPNFHLCPLKRLLLRNPSLEVWNSRGFGFFYWGNLFRIWIRCSEMWLSHLQVTERYSFVSIWMDILPRDSSFIYGEINSLARGKILYLAYVNEVINVFFERMKW